MVTAAELVVVMDARQRAHVCATYGRRRRDVQLLSDLDPLPDSGHAIVDPVDRPLAVFDACYSRIARNVAEPAKALAPQR